MMASRKINFYRINTGCKGLQGFDLALSQTYRQEYLEKRNKLGTTANGQPFVPEHFHTMEMLAEGMVIVPPEDIYADDGVIDTDSKDEAKLILRGLSFMSGAQVCNPADPNYKDVHEQNIQKLVAFWNKILDKSSPRDVIKELEDEYRGKQSVKSLKAMIDNKKPATTK